MKHTSYFNNIKKFYFRIYITRITQINDDENKFDREGETMAI